MREARKLLNKSGLPLIFLVVAFSLVKDYVIVPVNSLIWRLTLMTTPDGYIGNANVGRTLLRCPWIIPIGIIMLLIFLLFSTWQIATIVIGVACVYEGRNAKIWELLIFSAKEVINGTRFKNGALLLYTAIILPFTDLFQATDMIGAFVMPEYIEDFINSKPPLMILNLLLNLAATYLAFRWMYVLPSFFLKDQNFRLAGKESFAFSKKKQIRSIIRLIIYGVLESVRIAAFPFIVLTIACTVTYMNVAEQPYAAELFNFLMRKVANPIYDTVCGVVVYLSTMCYVLVEYFHKCIEDDSLQKITVPEVEREEKKHISGRATQITVTLLGTAAFVIFYLTSLNGIDRHPELVETITFEPDIIAHKGYSSIAPENTMEAFESADKAENADFIELDVWSTKDGIPVVIHNETVEAATGMPGRVYDYSFKDLSACPASYSWDEEDFPEARIPSLEEVISTYAESTPLLIEIKGYKKDEMLPAKIVELMEKYDCTETSMIHSQDYGALKAVKECNPKIKCGLIQAVVTGDCYDLPYADFLSVEHTFVTETMVDQLHLRGKQIFVWTINDDDSIDSLSAMLVDGFITDYPDDIAEAVYDGLDFNELFGQSDLDDKEDLMPQSEFVQGDY